MKGLVVLPLLCFSLSSASANVYRCEQDGAVTYTDQPCIAGSKPAQLPTVTSTQSDHSAPDLARQYDADAKRQSESQAKADGEWLKKRGEDKSRDEAIRKATIENRVIKGMKPEQVQRVLNSPQSIEDQGGLRERWIYQNGRERRTIAFKDGVVSSDTLRSTRK